MTDDPTKDEQWSEAWIRVADPHLSGRDAQWHGLVLSPRAGVQ